MMMSAFSSLHFGGTIRPYILPRFHKDDNRHKAIITGYFVPNLHIDLKEIWIQQNGAKRYTADATKDMLKKQLDELIKLFFERDYQDRVI